MNEIKNTTLEIERGTTELLVFIAEEPNLNYTITTDSEKHSIEFNYPTRDIDPVVALVARKSNETVTLSKIYITESNEIGSELLPFNLGQYKFHKELEEKMIHNGVYFTARIVE